MIHAAPGARLPDGFAVRLSPTVRKRPDGALLGGSPLRLMRLSARARDLLDGDRVVVRDATGAALAARLMRAWRNDGWPTSERRSIVETAIAEHDNGWHEPDEAPILDSQGRILDFVAELSTQ